MDVNKLAMLATSEASAKKKDSAVSDSTTDLKDTKLKKACADFEGVLLGYMMETMKKTIGDGGVFKNNFRKDMYESMFTQAVSTSLARGKGMGLGDTLYRQISSREKIKSDNIQAKGMAQEKVPLNRYK